MAPPHFSCIWSSFHMELIWNPFLPTHCIGVLEICLWELLGFRLFGCSACESCLHVHTNTISLYPKYLSNPVTIASISIFIFIGLLQNKDNNISLSERGKWGTGKLWFQVKCGAQTFTRPSWVVSELLGYPFLLNKRLAKCFYTLLHRVSSFKQSSKTYHGKCTLFSLLNLTELALHYCFCLTYLFQTVKTHG